MSDERIEGMFREAAARGWSRRELLRRGAAAGLVLPLSALTGPGRAFAQATPEGSPMASPMASPGASPMAMAAGDASLNPLGVDPAAPLDVVIFKGGYGDEYALYVNDQMYKVIYPQAQITYAGTQRLQEQYQARFVEGNPPDIMDNSGAGNFNTTNLVNEGQLADLTDLMEAPAWGQEGTRFADTLIPGSQADGVFNGTQYVLKYAYSAFGLWYSARFMEQNGYSYPETWDDMLALSEEIKAGGVAPWTFQGQYPYYIRAVFDQLVYKNGGIQAIAAIDNLEEGAWQSEPVEGALNALYQLVDRELILDGTEALSHTESQALWLQGRAAFIPCGSWLENEMRDVIAQDPNLADFRMTVQAVPSLTTSDALPRAAIQASAGEDFIVPAQGNNVQGGKEYLRLLFSLEGARSFSEKTRSLTSVVGAADGLDLGTALGSVQAAVNAAGENVFAPQYYGWYADLDEETQNLFGQMMAGQLEVQDVMDGAEDAATTVREDDSIPKFRREV